MASADIARPPGAPVAELAWPEIAARLADGAIAVLPIGAAAKEHGPHLPLGTDAVQAQWLASTLCGARKVLVWPTLTYGFYPVFVDYPGSISLGRATFIATVREILDGIAAAGATRIAILKTGVSTIEPLRVAAQSLLGTVRVRLINVYAGPVFMATSAAVAVQAFGGHADEIETSIMLALAPALVKMALAGTAATPIERGLFNRQMSSAANYSPLGINGDASVATTAKGQRLLDALRVDLLAEIDTMEETR